MSFFCRYDFHRNSSDQLDRGRATLQRIGFEVANERNVIRNELNETRAHMAAILAEGNVRMQEASVAETRDIARTELSGA